MFKRILLSLQTLAMSLSFSVSAEQKIAKSWLDKNPKKIAQKEVLDFVICEAGQ